MRSNKKWSTNPTGKKSAVEVKTVYQNSARSRNLCWNITDQQCADLIMGDCHYCGRKAADEPRGCNGIDRVDNKRGYEIDNVVSCCTICNRMKMNLSRELFLDHVARIIKHQHGIQGDQLVDVYKMELESKERAAIGVMEQHVQMIRLKWAQEQSRKNKNEDPWK